MNETSASDRQDPPSSRPGRAAVQGELRRCLQQLFPDLDPDVVSEVLGFTGMESQGEK